MKFVQLYSVIEDNKISITLLCISFSIIQHELLQNLILNFKKKITKLLRKIVPTANNYQKKNVIKSPEKATTSGIV